MTAGRHDRAWAAALITTGVLATMITACSPDPEPTASSGPVASASTSVDPQDPVAPKSPSLGITQASAPGTPTEVFDGLTVTLPPTAREDTAYTPQGSAPGRAFRLSPDGANLPAVEVVAPGVTTGSLAAVSWTDESVMLADPSITDVRRSVESWPGATEAVAMSWTQEVATAPEPVTLDAFVLWLRDAAGQTYKISAYVPTGTLAGSEAYAIVLSSQLDGEAPA